jgi:hypothetical protein
MMAEKTTDHAPHEAQNSSGPPKMRLNIVIMTLGTRGDLQPALEIAKLLHFSHGHRVRMATHPVYKTYIEAAGIEFYSTGDRTDPKEMQKRRLLTWDEMKPLVPTIKAEFEEMGERFWKACVGEPDGLEEGAEGGDFVADAIIATMQCFDQTSVAARLGVPIHMLGTNVRTSTKYLPHSQAEKYAKGASKFKNKFSFWMFDFL